MSIKKFSQIKKIYFKLKNRYPIFFVQLIFYRTFKLTNQHVINKIYIPIYI